MAKTKKIRNLLGILKDKISLIKVTRLLTNTRNASLQVAILRATSHSPSDSPPTHVDEVLALALGHHHTPTTGALLHALLKRVHSTSDAYVALKCLLTFHHVISRGSQLLNDQTHYNDGPIFQLDIFRDQSDADTWEISNWVRWYAATLDRKISVSSSNSLISLISMVEQISGSPDSLHYQRISLIYEVIKLIGEDYRIIMRDIHAKIEDYGSRISDFNDDSLIKFVGDLERIEECKEKLFSMFLNKKKNDGVWELIEKVRNDAFLEKQRRENMRMVKFQENESSSLTRVATSRVDESKQLAVVSAPRGKRWLDVEWNKLVVSTA